MLNSKYYSKLLAYALVLLTKKEYTSFQIQKKLTNKVEKDEENHEVIEEVMERLRALGYIDDVQYATNFIINRCKSKPRGKMLIEFELKKRGIDKFIVREVFEKQEVNEYKLAIGLLDKKMLQWKKLDGQKKKERAYRFLKSKGFKSEAIYNSIKRYYNHT
jgi:regulatory protein